MQRRRDRPSPTERPGRSAAPSVPGAVGGACDGASGAVAAGLGRGVAAASAPRPGPASAPRSWRGLRRLAASARSAARGPRGAWPRLWPCRRRHAGAAPCPRARSRRPYRPPTPISSRVASSSLLVTPSSFASSWTLKPALQLSRSMHSRSLAAPSGADDPPAALAAARHGQRGVHAPRIPVHVRAPARAPIPRDPPDASVRRANDPQQRALRSRRRQPTHVRSGRSQALGPPGLSAAARTPPTTGAAPASGTARPPRRPASALRSATGGPPPRPPARRPARRTASAGSPRGPARLGGRRAPARRAAAGCRRGCRCSSANCVSDLMSIRHPVRRAARRAFWPSLPIARDSW